MGVADRLRIIRNNSIRDINDSAETNYQYDEEFLNKIEYVDKRSNIEKSIRFNKSEPKRYFRERYKEV